MSARKITKLDGPARTYGAFIKRLQVLGCIRCPRCRDYVYPEHLAHPCGQSAPEPVTWPIAA